MPSAHNLGNSDQMRDGLEPCPRDELVAQMKSRVSDWRDEAENEADWSSLQREYAQAADRLEANQSSLDTMGGRIEALADALELFVDQAVFDPHTHRVSVDEFVLSKARAAVRFGPISRSHAPHQAPVGLGRSGFDRGQGE